MKTKLLVALSLCALLVGKSHAYTVNVGYDNGSPNTTTALTGFGTTGSMMDGMVVTVFFGLASDTAIWSSTGVGSGGAFGAGWSLTESGDTFGGLWHLTNNSNNGLTRLLIDAGPGDTVYDTTAIGDVAGTDGSARGWSFQVSSISAADSGDTIDATYRGAVGLGVSAPVGDLFRYLDVSFSDGLSSGSTLSYITDTDNLRFAGDIQTVPDAMSTLGGLGLTLVGLLAAARRRIR